MKNKMLDAAKNRTTQQMNRRLAAGVLIAGATCTARTLADEPDTSQPTEAIGPRQKEFQRDYPAPGFKPSWKNPQINRELGADFVIYAHSDLKMVEKLLKREPGLLNASIDWGNGDFETALEGASHMGRHDIVEFLIARGARPNLHCLAMLGLVDAVKALLDLEPKLIDSKGPHGFSLHFHAQVGGDRSKEVLDHLQSLKKVELRPIPFLKNKK